MSLSHQNRRSRAGDRRGAAGRMGTKWGRRAWSLHRPTSPRTFPRHHADPGQSGGLPGEKGSMLTLRVMVVSVLASSPTGGSPSRTWRGDSPSIPHRERRSVGPDRHDGSGGRARGGVGGAPGAVRGGVVSKSATKAFRDGIGREKKCGIPTFLLLRSGSVGVFVADLDNRRRQ